VSLFMEEIDEDCIQSVSYLGTLVFLRHQAHAGRHASGKTENRSK
jgi:hypothetical protein